MAAFVLQRQSWAAVTEMEFASDLDSCPFLSRGFMFRREGSRVSRAGRRRTVEGGVPSRGSLYTNVEAPRAFLPQRGSQDQAAGPLPPGRRRAGSFWESDEHRRKDPAAHALWSHDWLARSVLQAASQLYSFHSEKWAKGNRRLRNPLAWKTEGKTGGEK